MSPPPSTYDRIHAIVNGLVSAAAEKEQMDEHQELVALIEAGRHLLIGAKALTAYMEQRFTKDTDYLVDRRTLQKVRKWLTDRGIEHTDLGEAIQSPALAIDVIDADYHPVLKEILKRETGLPSPEALAAAKYVAIVSGQRDQRKRYLDISDFVGLVTLGQFDVDRFTAYLVDSFEEQRPHARQVVEQIKKGQFPVTI